jgi:hypothetical protein
MKMQQELEKSQLADQIQKETLADKIAHRMGTGGYAKRATPVTKSGVTMSGDSVWGDINPSPGYSGSSSGKQPKYVAGTGDFMNDESTDDASQIKTDFEAFHPGLYGKFVGAQRDADGNYVIPGHGKGQQSVDASGNVVTSPPEPAAVISKEEGDLFKMRIDAARRRSGIPYKSSIATQGEGATADKPVVFDSTTPSSKLLLRSLPPDTFVHDSSTNQTFQIGRKKAS